MNIPNILALADFIEQHQELPFNMQRDCIPRECGSAGCIGGFSAVLWPELAEGTTWDTEGLCAKLDIDYRTHDELCFPGAEWRIKRDEAIQALRELAKTGEVHYPSLEGASP